MANTYSQLYLHVVFAVEARQHLIRQQFKEELQKYITGIVNKRGQKLLAIHCMPDHTHILLSLNPTMVVSDLVREIKRGSSYFINQKRWISGRFGWQEGFGAFSYGQSQVPTVIRYIKNQEMHHARSTFRDEYVRFLRKYQINYDDRFIFKEIAAD